MKAEMNPEQSSEEMLMASMIADVLRNPASRRFMVKVVYEIGGLQTQSFTGNSETFFREGRRSVARELAAMMNELQPVLWERALEENLEDIK